MKGQFTHWHEWGSECCWVKPGYLHICMCALPFHFPGRPSGILSVDGQMHRWSKKVLGTAKMSLPEDTAVSIFCDKILCWSVNAWQSEAYLQNQHRPNIQLNLFSRWLALFLHVQINLKAIQSSGRTGTWVKTSQSNSYFYNGTHYTTSAWMGNFDGNIWKSLRNCSVYKPLKVGPVWTYFIE